YCSSVRLLNRPLIVAPHPFTEGVKQYSTEGGRHHRPAESRHWHSARHNGIPLPRGLVTRLVEHTRHGTRLDGLSRTRNRCEVIDDDERSHSSPAHLMKEFGRVRRGPLPLKLLLNPFVGGCPTEHSRAG